MIRWDWITSNVDQLAEATLDHVVLTAVAVGVGFIISFGLSVLIYRNRRLAGPI